MRGRKPELGNDPDAVKLAPRAPGWLSAQAKAEWRRIMPLLIVRRILTEADMASVENYCVAIGQVRATEDIINREGFTIVTANGLRAHPAVRIQSDAMTRARLLAAELGLTPVSRSRPAIRDDGDGEDDSPLDM